MAITRKQILDVWEQFLHEKWGYVYGAQGETWSAAMAEDWIRSGMVVPSGNDRTQYFRNRCARWIGRRVADCSGGWVYAMRQFDPKFSDRNANTFNAQFVKSGSISTIPNIPGLAVWRSGHIGIYRGNGQVIEFRGTDYGCVLTNLADRNFTRWGMVNGIDYSDAEQTTPVPSSEPFFAECSGGSVNVRSGRGTHNAIIGVLNKGDKMLALPAQSGWCEISCVYKGKLLNGFMSATYVKEAGKA